jgi:hypothetical protein
LCLFFETVSLEKWCRLRGNLLFYLKSNDQFSEPQGVIVLERYRVAVHSETREYDGFAFYLGESFFGSHGGK